MNILGVAFLSDASAAVLRNGELVSAVSEERINRIKQWNGIPYNAINMALELAGLTLDEIDIVATHGQAPPEPDRAPFEEVDRRIRASSLGQSERQSQLDKLWSRYEHEKKVMGERTPGYLNKLKELGRPMDIVAHHESHAACAYYGSGWDDCIAVTADGWGEDGSSTVWRCGGGKIERIARTNTIDSLGYFYGSITKALGFIPHRHEGKVLGLAAYCQDSKSYERINRMIGYDPERGGFVGRMEDGLYAPNFQNSELEAFIKNYSREDVSAAAQKTLETAMCAMIAGLGGRDLKIALAGGIFANVKLNQRIWQLPNVGELFVFPNMGDGGLSVGAAWLASVAKDGRKPEPLKTVLLGNGPDKAEIENALAGSSVEYSREAEIEKKVAGLLADGNVVAHFDSRMEFGPRALGNRSILYKATDPEVNKWLNDRLSRSEFMPFAPATLEEYASECYIGLETARVSAKYMTVTFDCTEKMKQQSPAAVHIDGTARPQIISIRDYPRFHKILTEYHRLTGIPSVINTSFNMHEEPIVCTAEDAVRAFLAADLPYLAIGDYLVRRKIMPLD